MAVVNIELSEYDALRESLKDYKERVAKLDNELSGLKKGENAVVTTKYCVRKVENIEELVRNSIESLKYTYTNDFYIPDKYYTLCDISRNKDLINCLSQIIRNAFIYGGIPCGIGDYEVKESSTEIQGYNDLRLVIENKLKEEAKAEIESLKQSYINKKEEYEDKYSELKDKFEEEFKEKSDKLEKEYKDKFEQFENTIENKDKTIVDLQTKLSEKTASLNDTDKKLIESIRYKNDYFDMKVQNERLTEELEKYKKPSLLNKIFNW